MENKAGFFSSLLSNNGIFAKPVWWEEVSDDLQASEIDIKTVSVSCYCLVSLSLVVFLVVVWV